MVERADPGRAGVKAGRIVGVVTGVLAVLTLLEIKGSFYAGLTMLFALFDVAFEGPVWVLFWGNALAAAVARYSFTYVVGSLIGVVYDWLDDPPWPALVGLVLVVGVADGLLGALDARNLAIGGGYVLAWLLYVPAFLYYYDPDAGDIQTEPRRLS